MNQPLVCFSLAVVCLAAACTAEIGETAGARGSTSGTGGSGGGSGNQGGAGTDGTGGVANPSGSGGATGVSGGASGATQVDSGAAPVPEGGALVDGSSLDGPVSYDSSARDPGIVGDGVREIGPGFSRAPETNARAGVPHGQIVRFTIAAGTSKIFPKAPNRPITVYIPAQYVAGTPAPVMVVQDGDNFYGFVSLLSTTLDNLIADPDAAKKLPPIVAVYANNGGGDAQGSERGLEYDTLSGAFAQWADQELLPRVEMETKTLLPKQAVTFTHDPEGRGSMGGSSGGIASFSMLWWEPNLFRRAIAFSGTFVAQESPKNPLHPLGGWNYHEDGDLDDGGLIAKETPIKPIRAWLECGTRDNGSGSPASSHYNFELANQRMALKLGAKGYHVHLDHAAGAGHVDYGVMSQTLPEALRWVWRGYGGN